MDGANPVSDPRPSARTRSLEVLSGFFVLFDPTGSVRASVLGEQECHFLAQRMELSLDEGPNESVIDPSVGVTENVPEGDDSLMVGNPECGGRIDRGNAAQGLADDLELPLDGRSEKRILLILEEIPTRCEPGHRHHGR